MQHRLPALINQQAAFHVYAQALESSRRSAAPPAHGRVAIKCMAGMLAAAPHFNYASGEQRGAHAVRQRRARPAS